MMDLLLDSLPKEKYKAVLLDLSGKKINEFRINKRKPTVNMLNLPESIYILQIFKSNGDMHSFKLVKN